MSEKCALYFHLNAAGEYLYVGRSISPIRRSREHSSQAAWYADVARIDIVWCEDVETARRLEKLEIGKLRPKHNDLYNRFPKTKIDPEFWVAASEYDGERPTDELKAKVEAVARQLGKKPSTVAAQVGLGGDFLLRIEAGAEVRIKTRNKVMPRLDEMADMKAGA